MEALFEFGADFFCLGMFPEGFEIFTADALQARMAGFQNEGYDLYKSQLFPDVTFQVKYARARVRPAETKLVNGRLCEFPERRTWTWTERIAGSADFYVLFGINDGITPFLLCRHDWLDVASDDGNGGKVRTTTANEWSNCGRYMNSSKRNRFWRFALKVWPEYLLARVSYYIDNQPMKQGTLIKP